MPENDTPTEEQPVPEPPSEPAAQAAETPPPEPDLDIAIVETEEDEIERGEEPCADAPERLVVCGNPVGLPRAFVSYAAVKQMLAHARSDTTREIGGVLVGRSFRSKQGLCTQITGSLAAENTEAGLAHVTFSHDTWNDIYRRLDEQGDDAKIVGWYHSHPGFGIFLSNQDLFIQRNFFTAPGQIAVVVDPVGNRWGAFRWVKEEVKPAGGFWVFAAEPEQVTAAQQLVTGLAYALHVPAEPTILDRMVQPFANLADGVADILTRSRNKPKKTEDGE
jgi:proteasome lid subunit RPN8/RPN11